MNSVRCRSGVGRVANVSVIFNLFSAIILSIYFAGCSEQVRLPSAEQLAEFQSAGPVRPVVNLDKVEPARTNGGLYCVVPGDVLELSMPAVLQVYTAELPASPDDVTPLVCRVSSDGSIMLPIIGQIQVAGKSLAEIESAVIKAYYPRYAVIHPSVLARVLEYKTARVSVSGAVKRPGTYELRSNQMSLVALLKEAEGIVDEGAAFVRITHLDQDPADNELVAKHTIEQPDLRLAEATKTKAAALPTSGPNSGAIPVTLSFKQFKPPDTIGRLTIKHNETILLTEELDITGEIQRQGVLKNLAQEYPRVSVGQVKHRLCELAELLEPGAGICSGEEEVLEILGPEENREIAETAESGKSKKNESVVLPVKDLNIPFADVALKDGDTVEVERFRPPLFTVIGLVNKPGSFPYPPDVRYSLMEGVGLAGGFNPVAEPRYATVYRLKADGTIVSATFRVRDGSKLTDASNIPLKPGDIVDVEHTPQTRRKVFLGRFFRLNLGAYLPLTNLFE